MFGGALFEYADAVMVLWSFSFHKRVSAERIFKVAGSESAELEYCSCYGHEYIGGGWVEFGIKDFGLKP